MLRCKWSALVALALTLLCPVIVLADEPDYATPASFALPWSCGEGFRVTWGPQAHWDHLKATGVAFDFSMVEGTPLYSPVNGWAYYLRDERPFETNFGHYVEIVDESGDWLIRLAHLRDPQSGEGPISAGDLIGLSGMSGAEAAHLHLEFLVRDGDRWVRPDPGQLEWICGCDVAEWTVDAIVTNSGCAAEIVLDGEVRMEAASLRLGDASDLLVPLRNSGIEETTIDSIQVLLETPLGESAVAEAHGEWVFGPKGTGMIWVPFVPDSAGAWRITKITCVAGERAFGWPATGALAVAPSGYHVTRVEPTAGMLAAGDTASVLIDITNAGTDASWDEIFLRGKRPDGGSWTMSLSDAQPPAPGESMCYEITSNRLLTQVGTWTIDQIGYRAEGKDRILSQEDVAIGVLGPELRVAHIEVYPGEFQLYILLHLANVGTESVVPQSIEVWGWRNPADEAFVASRDGIRPIRPGESAVVLLQTPTVEDPSEWRVVDTGYWLGGRYRPMPIEERVEIPATRPEADVAP